MARAPEDQKRECPTRRDGAETLICHLIDPGTCQERQRRHYHKCHTCAWQNATALGAKHVLPPLREPTPEPVPLRVHRAS